MNKINRIAITLNKSINLFTLKMLLAFLLLQFVLVFTPNLTPIKYWEVLIILWIFLSRKYYQLKIAPKRARDKAQGISIYSQQMEKIIKKYRKQLPASSLRILFDIQDIIVELGRNEEMLALEDQFLLKQSVKDYIPATIKKFFALPDRIRNNPNTKTGAQARALLDKQLIIIKERNLSALQTVSEVAYGEILKNQRFLTSRLTADVQHDVDLRP